MAASEGDVKTIYPKAGQLCTRCQVLIPGASTVPIDSKEWGTLKSITSSAQECSLCAVILSGKQNWLEANDAFNQATIDDRPLELTLTESQRSQSGVWSNMLAIFLSTGKFSYPHFFNITACESDGMFTN